MRAVPVQDRARRGGGRGVAGRKPGHHAAQFKKDRPRLGGVTLLGGVLKALAGDKSGVPGIVVQDENFSGQASATLSDHLSGIVDLMSSASMVLGLVAAAALLAATIWVRRYRDEST